MVGPLDMAAAHTVSIAENLDCNSTELLQNIGDDGSIIGIHPQSVLTQILPGFDEVVVVAVH